MGQRLVVELIQDQRTIAVVYYHWSAYFQSTIYEVADLCEDIIRAEKKKRDVLESVLTGLERRRGGLGIEPVNIAVANALFPGRVFKTDISRNNGLLYLGDDEIKRTLNMAEGIARIYLDDHDVTNDVDICEVLPWELHRNRVCIGKEVIMISPFDLTMEQSITLRNWMEKQTEKYYGKEHK